MMMSILRGVFYRGSLFQVTITEVSFQGVSITEAVQNRYVHNSGVYYRRCPLLGFSILGGVDYRGYFVLGVSFIEGIYYRGFLFYDLLLQVFITWMFLQEISLIGVGLSINFKKWQHLAINFTFAINLWHAFGLTSHAPFN